MTTLHRIEGLAGDGRYAVTFQRPDRSEESTVVQVSGDTITVAEASLPEGWTRGSEAFAALAEAVLAVQRARGIGPKSAALSDVPGGWDVMMGNVVLDEIGVPTCTGHGAMLLTAAGEFECAECGARAIYTV